MRAMTTDLDSIGYADGFTGHAKSEKRSAHEPARVFCVHKDRDTVSKGQGEVFAELSGHLLYSAGSVLDLPTTGYTETSCLEESIRDMSIGQMYQTVMKSKKR
jgi:hypothetical protein